MYKENLNPLIRYPGGSYYLACKLIKYIPEHRIYVEPFFGGGSMFWKKPLAEINIINDLNREVIEILKFARSGKIKECDFSCCLKMSCAKSLVREKKEYGYNHNICEHICLTKITYPHRGGNITPDPDKNKKVIINLIKNMDSYIYKLRRSKIYNTDYKEVVFRYDTPETFIFFDPPWKNFDFSSRSYIYSDKLFDYEEFFDILTKLKSKFILIHSLDEDIYNLYFQRRKYLNIYKIPVIKPLKPLKPLSMNRDRKREYVKRFVITNYSLKGE